MRLVYPHNRSTKDKAIKENAGEKEKVYLYLDEKM